jgi:quercetin dioxygenase-like cupin family protein
VEQFRFDAAAAFTPAEPLLEGVTVAPLTDAMSLEAPVQAAVFRLRAGGRIARHPASVPQILAVLDGDGTVSGADGTPVQLAAGDAVYWAAGEEHETATERGLTALVLEGDAVRPLRPRR